MYRVLLFLITFMITLGLSRYLYAMKALNTAAAGMAAQEANLNTLSNNISNVNTIGYKKSRTEFEDLLYETVVEAGSRSSGNSRYNIGVQIGTGTKVAGVRTVHSQGNPQITNNPLDLMVQGEGFFGIVLSNNELRFSRNGSLSINAQGTVVTSKGFKLFPGFTVPANTMSITISESGSFDAYVSGQSEPINIGVVPIFTFTNTVGLKSTGGNLYRVTQSSGQPIQGIPGEGNTGSIMQGALETSNVNIVNEMTQLIRVQRAYDMNAKVMGIADQMLQTVNNIR